jgi:catechol 2,3-dioxygenase-like lactoylglutathione lyase family enzyme
MISGIRFTTVSTADLARARELFGDVMGMEAVGRQAVADAGYAPFWDLPEGVTGEMVVLRQSDIPAGQVRLVQFEPASSTVVRDGAAAWDTSAIKLMDFFVEDFQKAEQALQARGWSWRTSPIEYEWPNGEGASREAHVETKDGVILGIIEIMGPSRQDYLDVPEGVLFSEMATSSFLVPDLDAALHFYGDVLGLEPSVDMTFESEEMQRLIGLDAPITLRMVLLESPAEPSGKVGLLHYEGVEGTSLAERARPPHRGLLGMTFETDDLTALHQRLNATEARVLSPPQPVHVAPHGRVQAMGVQAPDGVRMGFFEQ